jgi:hypothetical protein
MPGDFREYHPLTILYAFTILSTPESTVAGCNI